MKKLFGHKNVAGLFGIVMSLLLIFTSLFHGGIVPVYAEELSNNVITGASLTDTNGNPFTYQIGAWHPFRINVQYKLPNNTVHAGDTTTMTLPVGFSPAQPFQFEVKAGNDVVANGKIIDGNPAKVVLTYTSYVDTHSDIQGSFYFNAQINSNTQTQTGDIPVTLTVSGDQAVVTAGTVKFNPPKVEPVPLIKAGWADSNDKTIGHYKINVNQTNQAIVGAVLVDQLLNPGVEYVEGSFQVLEGVWVKNPTGTDIQFTQERDITAEFANKISVQGNRFTIAIGSRPAGKGLQIRYKVKINYEVVAGEVFKNEVELDNNGQNHKYVASYKIIDANGSGEGYKFAIEIKKTDPNGRPLENAVFDVIRARSKAVVGQLKTDANGYAKLDGLLLDDYILREVSAPDGYSPAEDTNIRATDFDSATKTVTKTIINQPSKTSISVTKQWIGKGVNSVTVHLYADGIDTGQRAVLDSTNQWQYTFTNLDEYKNGNKIQYTVKEETLANYDSAITGDMANGFKITNTNTEKISIPVTKTWVGPAAASATVKLLADGVVKETVTLNAAGNWKHTFNNLPKYDATDGHEIVYKVQEEAIANYTTAISGTAATGFTITNTITGKVSIPVTKVWIGKEADSVTVNLYADGIDTGQRAVLDSTNQWQYTFTNLDEYKNGNKIQYTVKEETLANYDSAITGDMANGFKITNTNTEKISIPVTKTWVGPAAASATVKLLADGVVKETVTLNAAGNWKHTFNNLTKYDATDGHEIVYTVDEENVTGYSTKITGDAKTGFTITNTKNTPKTYDNTNIGMFMILMVASLVILGVDIVIKKRYSSI